MERIADNSDRSLAHYGIPGMKWGKRRAKSNAKTSEPKKTQTPFLKDPNRNPPPAKGVTDLSPKHIKRISDVELRQRLNRMQMETQYKELTEGKSAPDKSKSKQTLEKLDKGHKAVQKVMAVAKTAQAIHKFVNSDLAKDIAKMIAKK